MLCLGTAATKNRSRLTPFFIFLALNVSLTGIGSPAQPKLQAFTDLNTFNVGSQVRLKVVFPTADKKLPASLDLVATVRYAGESRAIVENQPLVTAFVIAGEEPTTGYRRLWRIPANAKTGRYEIEVLGRDAKTHEVIFQLPNAASFAVHRKAVSIQVVKLDKTFYTAGDSVGASVTIKNLTNQPVRDLRVEFSDRYWPWIGSAPRREGVDYVVLSKALSLPAGSTQQVRSERAAVARPVTQPSIHQYGVVVWDSERKNVQDIAFSPLVIIRPPGVELPKPYPGQYIFSDLLKLESSTHRNSNPHGPGSGAIRFDTSRTMFASGSEARVRFTVTNSTRETWHGVSVRAELRAPDGAVVSSSTIVPSAELGRAASFPDQEAIFLLPEGRAGVYQARVEVSDTSGNILATNSLDFGVNPLPKSVLVFSAHEDDEGAHAGTIRAAVENGIPIHFVYFTSGDAGSCDRYYQHSCGPAEALNFGTIRMEETRAVLGHLGVPRENIYFLGLPDGGSGEIWYNNVSPSEPYRSVLLASEHAPYEGIERPNLPYARQSVIDAVKDFIKRFQPELIITADPPNQGHIDHIVNNYFVVKALHELIREGVLVGDVHVLVDRVYNQNELPATPYRYERREFYVSAEALILGQEAGWFYQSQGGNQAFANPRTLDRASRTQVFREILDWKDHEGWNEKR